MTRYHVLINRGNRLIKLKVKLMVDFLDIHTMAKENLNKIERCDRMIKEIALQMIELK